jgi:hypothetical protein
MSAVLQLIGGLRFHGFHDLHLRDYIQKRSLVKAAQNTIRLCKQTGQIATDGLGQSKILQYEPKNKYQVRLKDFRAWLDRQGRSPRDIIHRLKIREILGVNKLH